MGCWLWFWSSQSSTHSGNHLLDIHLINSLYSVGKRRRHSAITSPLHITNCVVNIQGGQVMGQCRNRGRESRAGRGREGGGKETNCDESGDKFDLVSNTDI